MAFTFQLLELDVSVCYYLVNRRKRSAFTFYDVIYKVEEKNNKKVFFVTLSWFYHGPALPLLGGEKPWERGWCELVQISFSLKGIAIDTCSQAFHRW